MYAVIHICINRTITSKRGKRDSAEFQQNDISFYKGTRAKNDRRLTRIFHRPYFPFVRSIYYFIEKLAWKAIKIGLSVKHPPSSVIETRNIKEPRGGSLSSLFFPVQVYTERRTPRRETRYFFPLSPPLVTRGRFKQILHLLNMQWRSI